MLDKERRGEKGSLSSSKAYQDVSLASGDIESQNKEDSNMKKLLSVLVVMAMLLAIPAFAQDAVKLDATKPVSTNPIDVAKSFLDSMNVKVGVEPYSEILISRSLCGDGLSADLSQQWYGVKTNIRVMDIVTISPFAAGVGNGGSFRGNDTDFDVDSDASLGYGVEARVDLPLKLPVDLAVLGSIRNTTADLNKVGDSEIGDDKAMNYLDYAFELQASKAFKLADYKIPVQGTVTPILGVRYSDMKVSGNPDGNKIRMDAKNNIGLTAGLQYDYNDMFGVSVKGKLIDQTAIEVAGIVRF